MPFIFQTFLERSRGIDLLSILRVGKLRLKELQRLTAAGKEPVIAAKQGHLRTCALMGRQTFPDLKDSHSCQALWTLWVGNSKSRGTGSLCSINLSDPSFKPVPRTPSLVLLYWCPQDLAQVTPPWRFFSNYSVPIPLPIKELFSQSQSEPHTHSLLLSNLY